MKNRVRNGLLGLLSLAVASALPMKAEAAQPLSYIKSSQNSYKTQNFQGDSDEVSLARTLFGEARNCSDKEKIAIAYTIINRANDNVKWNGADIFSVVHKPWQYCCYNPKDANLPKVKNPLAYEPKAFLHCLNLSKKILAGEFSDPTRGATSYHEQTILPYWAPKMKKVGQIDKHIFYKEK